MTRAAAWLTKNVPFTLTSKVRSKSASVASIAGLDGPSPALLTRMSIRPNSATACGDPCGDLVEVEHVHLDPMARRPISRISLDKVLTARLVSKTQGDVGSGIGDRQGDRTAQTAGGTGHQGDPTSEVESRKLVPSSAKSLFRLGLKRNARARVPTSATGVLHELPEVKFAGRRVGLAEDHGRIGKLLDGVGVEMHQMLPKRPTTRASRPPREHSASHR